VSAFGENGEGDLGDNFKVICSSKYWTRDTHVRIQHVETKAYMTASSKQNFNQRNCGNSCPIMDHLECAMKQGSDTSTIMKASLGIHLSK